MKSSLRNQKSLTIEELEYLVRKYEFKIIDKNRLKITAISRKRTNYVDLNGPTVIWLGNLNFKRNNFTITAEAKELYKQSNEYFNLFMLQQLLINLKHQKIEVKDLSLQDIKDRYEKFKIEHFMKMGIE